ncbi:GTP 3',8-cyclase MoaA [Paenibacillus silagei]|uniref:GTP 3',8-cyclase n=1 Tax=Paenibacillus silagei TaxID=1670801 RepID=A0ABS4NJ21_9BACL|nr:GTP 3',8-cyclase MoaA [Paenibacillus silagei]MBP2110036.1 cyclic pyranopterin phosphate synthase [Paenibacillus silagei]
MEPLTDPFGRIHDYLRISVTDRCNLRCIYCMPAEGMQFQPQDEIMSYEEIAAVVEALAPLGLRKVRLTGGEPLVRKDLEKLVSMIAVIPGIDDISLTTNGLMLPAKAAILKQAGLSRVNISLDSLRPDRFSMITRGGDVAKVLKGIEAAEAAGLSPIKLNVVLMKGINDDEIKDFIALTLNSPLNVRFIEYMPIGSASDAWRQTYLPLETVVAACKETGWTTEEADMPSGNGPSQNRRVTGAKGTFGLIHPVSEHFCDNCNRLRLTADGNIKACLYWQDEYNVRPLISSPAAVQALFREALGNKPHNHEMALALEHKAQSHTPTARRMSQIGG